MWWFRIGPDAPSYRLAANATASVFLLVCALLAARSSYRFLEVSQSVIMLIFLAFIIAAFVVFHPPLAEIASGLWPTIPEYSPWLVEKYPRIAARSRLVETMMYFTGLTAFTAIFLLLGATLLGPLKLVPHDAEVLTVQANFLTQLHSDLLPLYVICVLMVFFGTMYGGLEISTRALHELGAAIWPRWRRLRLQTVRLLIVGYALAGGLMVVWTGINPLVVVTPAAIFGGVFSCGLWCFAMLWADVHVPPALRMRFALRALLVAAGTIMTLLGVVAMYDYGRSFR